MLKTDPELAAKLCLSCSILAQEGHADIILGHVTARLPGQNYLHMKPSGLGLEEIKQEDIILIDLEGNKLGGGPRKCHTEYPIHTEIYKARADVNCVIHTHPPYATTLGATEGRIRPVSHEGVLFGDTPWFQETSVLIRTSEQGQAVAQCLGNAKALLMQNHGVVVAGASVEEATVYAILLEKAARMQCLAQGFSRITWSSEKEAAIKVQQIYHSANIQGFWDYYVRRARCPD